MFTYETAAEDRGVTVEGTSRYSSGDFLCTVIILPLLVSLLAVLAWLFWILAAGALGAPRAAGIAVVLLAGTAAFSWRTGRGLVYSLMMVGFGSFTLLTAALFAMAGYALIFGG